MLLNDPSPYVKDIIAALLPHCEHKQYPPNARIELVDKEPICYLFENGIFSVNRTSDNLVAATLSGPTIIGLGNIMPIMMDLYIEILEGMGVSHIPMRKAYEVFTANNLWETVAHHMFVVMAKQYTILKHLTAPTAYEIIRIQLIELMHEPPEIRCTISAERYIRSKTHLSRSGIMKILAALRTGKYITIEDGKLLGINKLPEKY